MSKKRGVDFVYDDHNDEPIAVVVSNGETYAIKTVIENPAIVETDDFIEMITELRLDIRQLLPTIRWMHERL